MKYWVSVYILDTNDEEWRKWKTHDYTTIAHLIIPEYNGNVNLVYFSGHWNFMQNMIKRYSHANIDIAVLVCSSKNNKLDWY